MSVLTRFVEAFAGPALSPTQRQLSEKLAGLEDRLAAKLLETIDLSTNVVQRDSADPDGTRWRMIGGGNEGESPTDYSNFASELDLTNARDYCRKLARQNPFAINLHENLVSYVVGEGHQYTVVAEKDEDIADEALAEVQDALEEWLDANYWGKRQQEIVVRLDRDGEVFLRTFIDSDGMTQLRFIEPFRIQQPEGNENATFGLECDPDDVETVKAYHIAPLKPGDAWERVEAAEIQHRKANVDCNVKRGVPTIYPIGALLERVGRLMENMGTIAEIQTAIAVIRRHMGGTKAGLENMRASAADYTRSTVTGRTENLQVRKKGAIIDASANTEYDFPPSPDVTGWIEGAAFNLRAAAARVCFPEFMLTSDASNSNYASTLVAEGPAVRMFQRRQAAMEAADLEIIWAAMERLAEAGRFDAKLLERIDIQCEPPTVEVRDEKAEADTNKVYLDLGILSKQTVTASIGEDYEQEQANIDNHAKAHPDEMKQAELAVMNSQSMPTADAANKSGRLKAVEHYLAQLTGEALYEHCGANADGGGGFQKGNTCAKGGVSGLKLTDGGTGKVIPDGTRLRLADGSTGVISKSGGRMNTKGAGAGVYTYHVVSDSNGMTDFVTAKQLENGSVEIADDQETPMNDSKERLKSKRGEFEKFTTPQEKLAPAVASTLTDIESLPDDAVISVGGVDYKRPAPGFGWQAGTVTKKGWSQNIGGGEFMPKGMAWLVDDAGEAGQKALAKALKAAKKK